MTNPKPIRRRAHYLAQCLDAENRKLRFELQQAKEQIRKERMARYLVADELAFERQMQAHKARQRNGYRS